MRFPAVAVGAMLSVAAAISLMGWRSARNLDAAHLAGVLPKQGVEVYLDFAALRQTGMLTALAGSSISEEPEYRKFVQDTGFDYRKDLDAAAITFDASDMYAAVLGNFQWKNLSSYAVSQGGFCQDSICEMPASQAGKFISYYRLRGRVLALAVSPNQRAAEKIGFHADMQLAPPKGALEISADGYMFNKVSGLPPGAGAFLSPLTQASHTVFFVAPGGDKIELHLEADCATPEVAADLAKQLTDTTTLLRNMLARDKMTPRADDLSGVLVGGEFAVQANRATGKWPLDRRFIENLFGAAR
jgi:hypothetical protein